MKRCYRIVTDRFKGYEVQVRRWWFPFWIQCGNGRLSVNTHYSLDEAEAFARKHARGNPRLVKNLGWLPDSEGSNGL